MKVVLLPLWNAEPSSSDVIGKVKSLAEPLPEMWQPNLGDARDLRQVEAFAFPTPFGWAEMMSAVIRQQLYTHPLFIRYEYLVLGLALGYLDLEIHDLKRYSLGQVLSGTDKRFRYFGLLRGTPRSDVAGKVFGGISAESLFWPSSRRSNAEWQELKELIGKDSHLIDSYKMLADFRELLTKQKQWRPEDVPWMKGLDKVIGDYEHSEGYRQFNVNSRLVGPILVSLPGNKKRPVYFPVYEKGFAADFLRALTGTFKKEEGKIAILDDKNRKQYEIRMPSVPPDGDRVLAGSGNVKIVAEPGKIREFEYTRIRLEDDEKGEGLFSILQPLDEALRKDQELYPSMGRAVETVKQNPFFYSDVIRIPVARLGEAGIRDTDVSFSDRAYRLAFEQDSPGLPLASELETKTDSTSGFILSHTDGGKTWRAIYIEKYAGFEVGDLKAMGWLLWSFFTGAAELQAGKLVDSELTPLLKDAGNGRIFNLTQDPYNKVEKDQNAHRRLATLQRFIKFYSKRANSTGARDTDKLCYEAAMAFVRFVWRDQPIIENGYDSQLQEVQVGSATVSLAKDRPR